MKVYKTLINSALFLFILYHPSIDGAELSIDLAGGVNLATIRGERMVNVVEFPGFTIDNKVRPCFNAGVGIEIQIADYFAINPEILFITKGTKSIIVEETVRYKSGYLEIPLLFNFYLPLHNIFPNVYTGPAFSILLFSKTVRSDQEIDNKKDVQNVDFGLAMGGGVDIQTGAGKFIFDIRYTLGFLDINPISGGGEIKNGVLSFILGYGININKK